MDFYELCNLSLDQLRSRAVKKKQSPVEDLTKVSIVYDEHNRLRTKTNGFLDRMSPQKEEDLRQDLVPYSSSQKYIPTVFPLPNNNVHVNYAKQCIIDEVEKLESCEVVEYTPVINVVAVKKVISKFLSYSKFSLNSVECCDDVVCVRGHLNSTPECGVEKCGCGSCNVELDDSLRNVPVTPGSDNITVVIKTSPVDLDCLSHSYRRDVKFMTRNVYIFHHGIEVIKYPQCSADIRLRQGLAHLSPVIGARPSIMGRYRTDMQMLSRIVRFYAFEIGVQRKWVKSLRLQALLKWVVHVDPPPE